MAERQLRLRLGFFVAVSILGLTGLVLLFGGAPTLFSSRTSYTISFPEAPGVGVGTPVRKSGVRVGEVTKVGLDEDTGKVRLDVLMDGNYLPRPSDEATITRGLLSGDTAVDFVPKTGADGGPAPKVDPYPPGTDITGVPPINPRTLLNEFSGVIPATQESLIKLSTSFSRFEQVAPKAEKAFDEVSALARASREIIPEFRQTNIRLQELIGGNEPSEMRNPDVPQPTLRTAMREISDLLRTIRPAAEEVAAVLKDAGPEINQAVRSVRRTSDSVNDMLNPENRKAVTATLKNIQAASDDLTKTIRLTAILLSGAEDTVKQLNARLAQSEAVLSNIGKATKPVADSADQIVKDIAETARTINAATTELAKTLSEVRVAVQRAGAGEGGTLQKVLTDPSLYNNLNDAASSTARLIARAEKVAKDLEVFADKIARRPETIGLGGVVHPSTGLKESPNAPIPQSTPLLPFAPAPGPTGPGPRVWPTVTQPVIAPSGEGPLTPIPPLSRESGVVPSYKPVSRPNDLPQR